MVWGVKSVKRNSWGQSEKREGICACVCTHPTVAEWVWDHLGFEVWVGSLGWANRADWSVRPNGKGLLEHGKVYQKDEDQ